MKWRTWFPAALCAVFLAGFCLDTAHAQPRRRPASRQPRPAKAGSAPAARWTGQTGEDHAGKSTTLGANGIQDIRIDIKGIPIRDVTSLELRGYGSGIWQWHADGRKPEYWAIHVIPDADGQSAALFFESGDPEKGRQFHITWKIPGQPDGELYFPGGMSDPTKAVPSAQISARWIGQVDSNPVDLTNPSPSVGPDGIEDAIVELADIPEKNGITSIDLKTADDKFRWSFGVNPAGAWNAELIREPKNATTAKLILAIPSTADGTIEGKKMHLRVRYSTDAVTETSLVIGKAIAGRAMPSRPLPKLANSKIEPVWAGPVERSKAGTGAVRLELKGMTRDPRVVSAVLTDNSGAIWATSDPKLDLPFQPLIVERDGADRAFLDFLPNRDFEGRKLSLRLIYEDGSSAFHSIAGGRTDLKRRIPPVAADRIQVTPGQDLQAAVDRGGTIVLAGGTYELQSTLVIDKPVRIEAAADSKPVLAFSAGSGGDRWRAAIKIRTGGVTLSGLSVRFKGEIPWNHQVWYGPAVIATIDPDDRGYDHERIIWGITLENLDIVGPEQTATGNDPPESVKLVRILKSAEGSIERCIFRGGTVHLSGGPWRVAQNRHDGPLPGCFTYDAFAFIRPLDLQVLSNRIEAVRNAGKLWRFMNMTQAGRSVRIEGNIVRNVGPRKGDTIRNMNTNEILLTESYQLKFEGVPATISEDGSTILLPQSPGGPPAPGDAVTVLNGDQAGAFVSVVQNLGGDVIRVEPPLPRTSRGRSKPVISVANGFGETRIANNTIDATGSDSAFCMALAGNHYGTVVTGNVFSGGGESILVLAYPTEYPNIWGWTHVPFTGFVFRGNKVLGAARPARFGSDQSPSVKSSTGRSYFFAELSDNTFEPLTPGPSVRIGYPGTLDPDASVVTFERNVFGSGSGEIDIIAGRINGQRLANERRTVGDIKPAR